MRYQIEHEIAVEEAANDELDRIERAEKRRIEQERRQAQLDREASDEEWIAWRDSLGSRRISDEPVPTRKKYITRTLTAYDVKSDNLTCAICLLEQTNIVAVLDCNHFYHRKCLKKWLKEKNVCPLCMC